MKGVDLKKGTIINTEKVMVAVLMSGISIIYVDAGVTIMEPMIIKVANGRSAEEIGIGFDPLMKFGDAESCDGINPACVIVKYPATAQLAGVYLESCKQFKAQRAGLVAPGM
jgi:hypothetical protein